MRFLVTWQVDHVILCVFGVPVVTVICAIACLCFPMILLFGPATISTSWPVQSLVLVPQFATRTLNATGQSRVTLSLKATELRAACGLRRIKADLNPPQNGFRSDMLFDDINHLRGNVPEAVAEKMHRKLQPLLTCVLMCFARGA